MNSSDSEPFDFSQISLRGKKGKKGGAAKAKELPPLALPKVVKGQPAELKECVDLTKQIKKAAIYKFYAIEIGNDLFAQPAKDTFETLTELRSKKDIHVHIAAMKEKVGAGVLVAKKLFWTITEEHKTAVFSPELDSIIKRICCK